MPRKTINKLPDVVRAEIAIKVYCENANISINRLSEKAGVSQSALSRFVNGERKSLTKTAKKALSYVKKKDIWHKINNNSSEDIIKSEEYKIIENAVLSYWDGSHQSAMLLAETIKALKPVLDMASQTLRSRSEGDDL